MGREEVPARRAKKRWNNGAEEVCVVKEWCACPDSNEGREGFSNDGS